MIRILLFFDLLTILVPKMRSKLKFHPKYLENMLLAASAYTDGRCDQKLNFTPLVRKVTRVFYMYF